jgi:hypothetical protein
VPSIPNTYRRGAAYYWRRRIPGTKRGKVALRQLVVSLGTRDPARARYLAGQLTALSDQLFASMRDPFDQTVATPDQLERLFREALLDHLHSLELDWAAMRSQPDFDPQVARRKEILDGWSYRIYAAHAHAARVDDVLADRMRADGLSDADIEEVASRLFVEATLDGPRHHRFDSMARRHGIEPTDTNFGLVHETIHRAQAAACLDPRR